MSRHPLAPVVGAVRPALTVPRPGDVRAETEAVQDSERRRNVQIKFR
jgi:hypothetical protein